tara:strand:+ start:129860 stop:130159 length:300 start_codon:yes stop_codon:yes gene_type:complete
MFKGNLIKVMTVAVERKPKYGQACNHCGYCCLTEVCSVGKTVTGQTTAPCSLLKTDGDNHYCTLGESEAMREIIGMGEGCCAKTQQEAIDAYIQTGKVA